MRPLHVTDPTYFGLGPTGCPALPFLVAGTRNDDAADSVAWCALSLSRARVRPCARVWEWESERDRGGESVRESHSVIESD